MQNAYISKLMELAEKDNNVLHILADSGTGYDELFRRNFPTQMLNFGIGEENMVAAAAGLATVGKIPFVYTAGAFLVYRSLEFIRDDVCFQNLNVKIVGMGSGLSWSSLGPTHHTTEDVALLRAIPNLMILSPATPKQVAECVKIAYNHFGPVYIRIGMNREREFFDDEYTMDESKNDLVVDGKDLLVYVTGSVLDEVEQAVNNLKKKNISVKVMCVARIKPFNDMDVIENVQMFKKIVTVEEHNVYGGLGSIIAEVVAYNGLAVKVYPIGIKDCFAEGYGSHMRVRQINYLDAGNIEKKLLEVIQDE